LVTVLAQKLALCCTNWLNVSFHKQRS